MEGYKTIIVNVFAAMAAGITYLLGVVPAGETLIWLTAALAAINIGLRVITNGPVFVSAEEGAAIKAAIETFKEEKAAENETPKV